MRQGKFAEEQIISILAEQRRGMLMADVCRRDGVRSATFYECKAKFGGMDVSDARRVVASRVSVDELLDRLFGLVRYCRRQRTSS